MFQPNRYWEKRLEENYTLQGVGDISWSVQFNEFMYRVRRYVFDMTIRSLDTDFRNATVADFGCGTGFYIDAWTEQKVSSLHGVDITTKAVTELSRKFPNASFLTADIGTPGSVDSLPDLDVASCFDVLYHIVDDDSYRTAVRNIAERIKPGGYFLLSENFLRARRLELEHQVCRTLDEIGTILNDAGFVVIRRRPVFVLMNDPIDGGWFLKRLFPRIVKMAQTRLLGTALTRILYLVELLLVRVVQEGPSTEIMVCRKK